MIFLVQTPHPWHGIRQRPHHLMTRLAQAGHTVHWIESRYLSWLAQRPGDFFRMKPCDPLPGLHVRPVTLLNGERLAPVRAFNRRRLTRACASAASGPAAQPRVLWLYNPHEEHLADSVPHDLLVYDIMDEYRGFPWSPPRVAGEEARLLARADWVFAGTVALFDAKRAAAGQRIDCILSGVETGHFAPHPAQLDPATVALRSRHRHVAGYAGMIDLRVDQGLLIEAARRLPDWGFALVGPVAGDASALAAAPNIHLFGSRPYAELPGCYHEWDVALLPFVENEVTRHINPTKMLEYAASGTPIVARALPDVVRCYADGAWLYRTVDEFVAHLQALAEPVDQAREAKLAAARAWADQRGWDALTAQMLARVEDVLKKKRRAGNI